MDYFNCDEEEDIVNNNIDDYFDKNLISDDEKSVIDDEYDNIKNLIINKIKNDELDNNIEQDISKSSNTKANKKKQITKKQITKNTLNIYNNNKINIKNNDRKFNPRLPPYMLIYNN